MSLRRVVPMSLALLLSIALAACGGEAPPAVFAPLGYDYLRPLRLNVATLDIEDHATSRGDDVAALSPAPPAQALTQMAHDRVFPGGSSGRAVFVIQDASIRRHGDTLAGSLAVRLDIVGAGGQPAAFAEARVARSSTTDTGDLRTRLYALTKQMMDDMNVEFEFQSRRALKPWLQPKGDVPAAVSVQPLSGSGGAAGAAAAGAATGGGVSGGVTSVGVPAYGTPSGVAGGPGRLPDGEGLPGRAMSPPPGSLSLPPGYATPPDVPPPGAQDPGAGVPAGMPLPAASPYSPAYPPAYPQQIPPRSSYQPPSYGQPSYGQQPYGQGSYALPGMGSSGTGVPYAPPAGLQSGPLPLVE